MEDVIATVSGYHGLERFKLIKLINYTGASYVGAMTKSTTHLVCWKLEGGKYDLAKSFGTIVVSHRWFEDCVKAGRRLPERHYKMKSGHQAGPLSWEVPVGEKETSLTRRERNALADMSNTCEMTRAVDSNAECMWSDSLLLSEDVSLIGTRPKFHKNKSSNVRKNSTNSSKQKVSHIRVDVSPTRSPNRQHGESSSCSSFPMRRRKNVCSTPENSITVEPTRKSRRLVKKNAGRDILESSMFDFGQESPDNVRNEDRRISDIEQDCSLTHTYNITAENSDLDCFINENIPIPQEVRNSVGRGYRNEAVEDVDSKIGNASAANNSSVVNEGSIPVQDMLSQHSSEENLEISREVDDKLTRATKSPAAPELSCVICWTEFSSTRGVLPCGHRFCYSCIQNWADHMASRRKVSTCPLCKASFASITKVDGVASTDQKIYSQTIPHDSSATDILVLSDWDLSRFRAQSHGESVCCHCGSREPEDLLVRCHLCSIRSVHSYCLDPPLFPWTCNNCRDLRMMYRRYC
ncbi:glutathione peroxidase [Ranunculus cassubicifolius]